MEEQNWYYEYDTVSKEYVRAVLLFEQAPNTTAIKPNGFVGKPIFDTVNKVWTGQLLSDWESQQPETTYADPKQVKAELEAFKDTTNKTVSSLMLQVAAQGQSITNLQKGGE